MELNLLKSDGCFQGFLLNLIRAGLEPTTKEISSWGFPLTLHSLQCLPNQAGRNMYYSRHYISPRDFSASSALLVFSWVSTSFSQTFVFQHEAKNERMLHVEFRAPSVCAPLLCSHPCLVQYSLHIAIKVILIKCKSDCVTPAFRTFNLFSLHLE